MIFVKPHITFLLLFIPLLIAFVVFLNGAEFTYTKDSTEGKIVLDTPLELLGFSALFGGVGAASIAAILYAAGILQSPATRLYPDVKPVSKEELIFRLLDLNDPELPWEIVRDEKYDLVARWKIADAKWWEITIPPRADICRNTLM